VIKYENPVHRFDIGDIVRIGNGKVEWEVISKGATSGMAVKNARGLQRSVQAFDVTLIRKGQ
jgi:hypothetical protein